MPLRSCPELLVSRIDFNGDPVDIVWGTGVALGESYRSVAARMRAASAAFFFSFFFQTRQKTLKIDARCTTRENGLLREARF